MLEEGERVEADDAYVGDSPLFVMLLLFPFDALDIESIR